MKEKDFRKDCLLTDSPVLARQTAARGLPVIYYERPGADPVYEADYTVQSLDDLDELFFQRVYERHYGLPWCIGETERLKIRESTEEDVEKLLEAGILVREMEELTGETQAYLFCHPDNQPSRKTAEKLCALYPEHFQTVVDQEKADSRKL